MVFGVCIDNVNYILKGKNMSWNKCESMGGYCNKPTYDVKLWIDNDEYLQKMFITSASTMDVYDLSKEIEDYFEGEYPLESASVFSDLLNWALAYVNWYEIAEVFVADAKEIAQ